MMVGYTNIVESGRNQLLVQECCYDDSEVSI